MPRGIHNWNFVKVKSFLSNYNFSLARVEGSHYFYVGFINGKVRHVSVPFHGNKSIHVKTMKSIVTQSGIDIKDWIKK